MTSLSYVDDGGFVPHSNWNSLTARTNVSIKIVDKLTFTSHLSASTSSSDRINNENAIFGKGDTFSSYNSESNGEWRCREER
ncbi:MAG: hypothetical protein R2757_03060 [Draconibacterium sp.]